MKRDSIVRIWRDNGPYFKGKSTYWHPIKLTLPFDSVTRYNKNVKKKKITSHLGHIYWNSEVTTHWK